MVAKGVTKGIEPTDVLGFFEDFCGIPHGSRNEAALSAYICEFAKARGLWYRTDDMYNVVIKKPGTAGYESSAPVMMQAHIDMVCEKNNDTVHDFMKDPIKLVTEGDFLRADGTTLGADNGIGSSIMLAVLDSTDIPHPPLECVFTTQEEIGLFGAAALDVSDLAAKTLINLDSSEEGLITVGCAGGIRAKASMNPVWISVPQGYTCYDLSLKGLLGGHSGGDIIQERGNANIMMARALQQMIREIDLRLVSMNGGSMDNAIPRECSATIVVAAGDEKYFIDRLEQIQATYKKEYRTNESGVNLTATKSAFVPAQALSTECVMKLFGLILLAPSGVLARSLEMDNLVETSNNVAVVRTEENCLTVRFASRSSVDTRKEFVMQRMRLLGEILGVSFEFSGEYPGWEYAPHSRIREVAKQAYVEQYGTEPNISGRHGGLEPGILGSKIPGLDSIAMGPTTYGLHSPDERLSLSSLQRTNTLVRSILAKLN
ncbi:MAG: aminoacyl-histidine dipeptidase [Defluviitaleaceae bacterium]|nr:aminoacyl-histidine dipeptidase [Defluviitaleaceae bacterium]